MRSLPGIVGQLVSHRGVGHSVEGGCWLSTMVVHKSGEGGK